MDIEILSILRNNKDNKDNFIFDKVHKYMENKYFPVLIGNGSYGFVIRWTPKTPEYKEFAIKYIPVDQHKFYQMEAIIMKKLKNCSRIVNYTDSGYMSKRYFLKIVKIIPKLLSVLQNEFPKINCIMMELMEIDLFQYTLNNIITEDFVENVLVDVCIGLLQARKTLEGFRHNDLSPKNIMIAKQKVGVRYLNLKSEEINVFLKIPEKDWIVKIGDLDFATSKHFVNKKSQMPEMTKIGINTTENDFYDLHFFLNYWIHNISKEDMDNCFKFKRLIQKIGNFIFWQRNNKHVCNLRLKEPDDNICVELYTFPESILLSDYFKNYIIDKEDIPNDCFEQVETFTFVDEY